MAIVRKRRGEAASLIREGLAGLRPSASDVRERADHHGIHLIPLDIKRTIEMYGLIISREPMEDDISGYLERRGDDWIIGVNTFHHPRRQRFTLAHELAHYLLHRGEQTRFVDTAFLRRDINSDPMEREADRFAGELMMPESDFRSAVQEGLRNVSDLANRFGTSQIAIRVRAKQLGYSGTGL